MALCEKILIAGFSGAGKSSFLKEIANNAPEDWTAFDDLDDLILKNRGRGYKDLASLIEAVGWEKFRLWERQELEGWLKEEGKGVLALGGGALGPLIWELYSPSRKIKFCYLKADFENCWERLNREKQELRPLVLKGKAELRKLYDERNLIFSKIEWQIVNDGEEELESLASEFWKKAPL